MNTHKEHFLEIRDHDKLLDACLALKGVAKEHQMGFLRQCIKNKEYYLGNQYLRSVGDRFEHRRRQQGQEWRPQTTRNVIGQTVDPIHAIIASASPSLNITPIFPDKPVMFNPEGPMMDMQSTEYDEYSGMYPTPYTGRETGEFFTEFLGGLWDSPYRKEYHARSVSMLDALICGTAFRGYSVREHPTRGAEIIVKNLQPQQVMLDPEGRDLVTFCDMRFVILISHLDVMTIKRKWPKVSEKDYGPIDKGVEFDDSTSGGFISRIFKRDPNSAGADMADATQEWSLRRYPVYMLYYSGWMPDLITTPDQKLEENKEFPYPRGRVVTWINDRKIVEDREVKTWGFTFPLVAFTPNPVPHQAYGQADVTRLIGPQDLINAFANIIVSNAILNGHTQLLVETGALDPRTFSVRPGAIMNIARDALRTGRIKQLFPGPLGSELIQFMLNLEHFTKEEVGDSAGMLRGGNPGSITSGLHAKTVQESAFTRQSFRIGLLDSSYEIGAFKEVNLIQQYLPLSNNYYRGYMGVEEGMDLAMKNLMFKVETESRKDLPFSSGGQFELYFAMLRNGDITHMEFFELAKFHISDEWKKKVEDSSKDAIPGLPPEIRAQQKLEAEMAAQEIANTTGLLGQGNPVPGQPPIGGGASQQPPSDMTVGDVGSVEGTEEL